MEDPAVTTWTEALRARECVGYGTCVGWTNRQQEGVSVMARSEANVSWGTAMLALSCMVMLVTLVVVLTSPESFL